jgi:hypothetical protein
MSFSLIACPTELVTQNARTLQEKFVKARGANPGALPGRFTAEMLQIECITKLQLEHHTETVVDFVAVKTSGVPQLSISSDFSALNLKGLREMRWVDLLVPNQIPELIELC